MPDDTNNIWVDSTFISPNDATDDTDVEFYRASAAENIGSYSLPVIYRTFEASIDDARNSIVEYFQTIDTVSGTTSVNVTYYDAVEYLGAIISLVDFSQSLSTVSGSVDLMHYYSTGQYEIVDVKDLYADYKIPSDAVEDPGIDFFLYYTNSTGYTNASGIYIPYLDTELDTDIIYNGGNGYSLTGRDEFVDVFFAGWVLFYNTIDVFSATSGTLFYLDSDVTTISGGVVYNPFDLFAAVSGTRYFDSDIYSTTVASGIVDFEAQNIDGGLTYIDCDTYNCTQTSGTLRFNVDLNPIRIFNFSLDIGDYTTASGFIYVDVVDDECNITTSGTYWMVDGVQVSGTLTPISGGYRVTYDPADDFAGLEGPTTFTIHAENDCGYYVELNFYLTFGYIVEFDNSPGGLNNIDYGFNKKVAVRVTAEDYASCPTLSSLAWEFESKQQFNSDLGASIVGRFSAFDCGNMPAKIYPQSTAYFYGKEFRVVVTAKDFAGNIMEPLVLIYKIEEKP